MNSIPEQDWKVFRDLRKVALERFCDRILGEARMEIDHPTKSAHEKYLSLFELIRDRDDDVARAFNDFRRSTARLQIGIIHSMGLLTADELARFSLETIRSLEAFASISKTLDAS